MPLARIISHSHLCCRELAVDLLARGYAVEIVSPDKIPNNFADLELRVDTDAANDLTAKVAARVGEHSSFIDFVHHLSAPMGNFVRRPPKPKFESITLPFPNDFNAEPNPASEIEIPARNETVNLAALSTLEAPKLETPKLGALSTALEARIPAPVVNSHPAGECAPALILGPEEVPLRQTDRPKRAIKVIIRRSPPASQARLKTAKGSGWFLRVAAGFCLIIALSAIPIVGIRGESQLAPRAGANQTAIATDGTGSRNTPVSHTASADAVQSPSAIRRDVPPPAVASANEPTHPVSGAQTAHDKMRDLVPEAPLIYQDKPMAKAGLHTRHERIQHRRHDDIVARDTVTYLDPGLSPQNH